MTTEVAQVITCPSCGAEIELTEALLYPFQQKWKKEWETESKQKLDVEKEKVLEEANKAIEELQSELKQKEEKLKETSNYERELGRKIKAMEEREEQLDLEVERKLDEEKRKTGEQHRLELLEKDKQLSDMRREIEELERRSEQISPQTRGDALQYELERALKSTFPDDEVEVIRRGARGADVIQKVKDEAGQLCGTILWESKNTARWNNGWIEKLKRDQREQKADIAVLASRTTPEHIQHFDMIQEDLWVTCLPLTYCLADVLRFTLIQISTKRHELVNMDQKVQTIYSYFTGTHFKQRIHPIAEALFSLQDELNREKRAMQSHWAQRQGEIEKALSATAGFYGDIRAIIGGAFLPQIEGFQLLSAGEE